MSGDNSGGVKDERYTWEQDAVDALQPASKHITIGWGTSQCVKVCDESDD